MQFPWTQSIPAGATFDPLESWNNRLLDSNGVIKINHRATAVGLVATVQATNRTLYQEAPVPAGGTSGQTPTDFNAPPLIEKVYKLEQIAVRYRNPTGGAIIVDGVIDFTPSGGTRGRGR